MEEALGASGVVVATLVEIALVLVEAGREDPRRPDTVARDGDRGRPGVEVLTARRR